MAFRRERRRFGTQAVAPVLSVGGALHLVPVSIECPRARRGISAVIAVRLDAHRDALIAARPLARAALGIGSGWIVSAQMYEMMDVIRVPRELYIEAGEDFIHAARKALV